MLFDSAIDIMAPDSALNASTISSTLDSSGHNNETLQFSVVWTTSPNLRSII